MLIVLVMVLPGLPRSQISRLLTTALPSANLTYSNHWRSVRCLSNCKSVCIETDTIPNAIYGRHKKEKKEGNERHL